MVVCGRYNKLGLDASAADAGRVAEVHELTRVTSEPLSQLQIVSAALGHTHSAVVTSKHIISFHFLPYIHLTLQTHISSRNGIN